MFGDVTWQKKGCECNSPDFVQMFSCRKIGSVPEYVKHTWMWHALSAMLDNLKGKWDHFPLVPFPRGNGSISLLPGKSCHSLTESHGEKPAGVCSLPSHWLPTRRPDTRRWRAWGDLTHTDRLWEGLHHWGVCLCSNTECEHLLGGIEREIWRQRKWTYTHTPEEGVEVTTGQRSRHWGSHLLIATKSSLPALIQAGLQLHSKPSSDISCLLPLSILRTQNPFIIWSLADSFAKSNSFIFAMHASNASMGAKQRWMNQPLG